MTSGREELMALALRVEALAGVCLRCDALIEARREPLKTMEDEHGTH